MQQFSVRAWYQVASMALTGDTDDTLEVCLNNYEMTEEEEEEDEDEEEVAICRSCHCVEAPVRANPHKVCKPGRVYIIRLESRIDPA